MPRHAKSRAAGAPPVRQPPAVSRPLAAAAVIGLQGAGLVVAGAYLVVRALQPDANHRGSTEVLGVMAIVLALGVFLMARATWRRRRAVRSPLLVLEIICLPIAVTTVQGGRWYVGVPLGLSAVAVVVLLGVAGLLLPRDD